MSPGWVTLGAMTDAKDTLDESAMVRLGRRLQEARMAMGYSTGGLAPSLMAARTQLEDIEAGRMGTFYSAHYFLALFQRYAAFLQFSPEAIANMVRELKGEEAQAPEAEPASEAEPLPEPAPVPELQPDPAPEPPSVPEASFNAPPKAPPGSSGLGDRLLALLALLAVAAVAWVLISEQGASPTPVSVSPSPMSAATAADSPAPAAVAAAPQPTAPPAVPTPTPTTAPLSAPEPTPPSTPAPASTPAESNGTAALVLRFPEKSWIWVRRADDSVSEVGIAAGSTLRFDEMPIYVVLPRPGEIQVTVRGRKAALARNDTERDMGRFTRTMLEQATAR